MIYCNNKKMLIIEIIRCIENKIWFRNNLNLSDNTHKNPIDLT